MRRILTGLAIAAVALTVAACSTAGGTGGTIDGTSWALKTYDVSGTATAVPAGTRVDAKFADGKVSGFAGCNVYNAPVTISGADHQGRPRRDHLDGLRRRTRPRSSRRTWPTWPRPPPSPRPPTR